MFFKPKSLLACVLSLAAAACGSADFSGAPSESCFGPLCVTSQNFASGSYDYRPTAGEYFGGTFIGVTASIVPQKIYLDPATGRKYVGWEGDNPSGEFAGRWVYRRWLDTGVTDGVLVEGTTYYVDPNTRQYRAPRKIF